MNPPGVREDTWERYIKIKRLLAENKGCELNVKTACLRVNLSTAWFYKLQKMESGGAATVEDRRKQNGRAPGITPATMEKYVKAKRLVEDEGLSITIACMRADLTRSWYGKIRRRLNKLTNTNEEGK